MTNVVEFVRPVTLHLSYLGQCYLCLFSFTALSYLGFQELSCCTCSTNAKLGLSKKEPGQVSQRMGQLLQGTVLYKFIWLG
jgi:hypothetical protein